MPRPLKVFLSHAHADATRVRALHNRLVADGVDSWLDKEKLIPGQDWEREIRKAVREADVVIVCLSKQFNQRGYRQKEVRIALDEARMMPEGEIFIIPARLEECENLESLRKWHWVDLFEKDGYERLLRGLLLRAKKVGTELQPKKSGISGVFKKSIVQRQSNPKPIKPYKSEHKRTIAKEKKENTFFEKFNALIKEQTQKIVIGILIIIFAYFVSFVVPSWISSAKSSLQTISTQTPTARATILSSTTLAPSKTAVPSPTLIKKTTPTTTLKPSATPTKVSTPTLISLSAEITDDFGIQMVLVPEGTFTMGSEINENEKPIHEVYLDAYYMDVYEVTNAAYKLCVKDEVCDFPNDTSTKYNKSEYANHPIVYIDWDKAKKYCEWRGARLPTEAEWEKAARGTDGRTYPWGEESPNCNNVNYGLEGCIGDTRPVGSYELGRSPYGLYDMAGNVWEWVEDKYDAYPGGSIGLADYRGERVIRGGSWKTDMTSIEYSSITTTYRVPYDYYQYNAYRNNGVGFRCAKDIP